MAEFYQPGRGGLLASGRRGGRRHLAAEQGELVDNRPAAVRPDRLRQPPTVVSAMSTYKSGTTEAAGAGVK